MKLSIKSKLIILFLLIISGAIILISWRGLDYFTKDKETYVQDINTQNAIVLSNFLQERIGTIERKIKDFSDFTRYSFASADGRKKALADLQVKLREFTSIGVLTVRGSSLKEGFGLYNTEALQKASLDKETIIDEKTVIPWLSRLKIGTIDLKNVTKSPYSPMIAIAYKVSVNKLVIATMPQNALIDIISKKQVYSAFVTDSQGNLIMHQDAAQLLMDGDMSSHPMVKTCIKDKEKRIASGGEYLDPFLKENMLGTFSHVGDSGLCLVVQIPRKMAYQAAKELIMKLSIWIVAIFLVAVAITLVFSNTITKPLKVLADFAKKVGKGDFSVDIKASTSDELGELVNTFNKMNLELKARDEKIAETHKQLVQSEKMGAFGQMSAGIAHEVKNPLAGILGYAQLAKKKAGEDAKVKNYLDIIEKETKRCKEIVENLMRFARAEKSEFSEIPFTKAVRDSVALVDHQITISGIKIDRKLPPEGEEGPIVMGNANQLTQVFTNIMLNAQYAMKKKGEGGTLTVEVPKEDNGMAKVVIQDSGTGIKPEHIAKLFDPFFTTKPAGEGTGLGLAVTYGIIKDHKGEIKVESEYGQWTKFIITVPVKK